MNVWAAIWMYRLPGNDKFTMDKPPANDLTTNPPNELLECVVHGLHPWIARLRRQLFTKVY